MPIETVFRFLSICLSALLLAIVMALRPQMKRYAPSHTCLVLACGVLLLNEMLAIYTDAGGVLAPTIAEATKTWGPVTLRVLFLMAALGAWFEGGSGRRPFSPPSSLEPRFTP